MGTFTATEQNVYRHGHVYGKEGRGLAAEVGGLDFGVGGELFRGAR